MTEEERKAHALRIAKEALDPQEVEFCYVYDDDELIDHDAEWDAIHDLILQAKVTVTLD